jgi:hypothetical protein
MNSEVGRGPPRKSPAPSPASDSNRANVETSNATDIETNSDFQWSGHVSIGDVGLVDWHRKPGLAPTGVIGFADVAMPRRGICRCRLRSYRGRVRVEWAGSGLSVQWREVNQRYAWAIVELIVEIDPGVRADDGSVPFIPSPAWGAP